MLWKKKLKKKHWAAVIVLLLIFDFAFIFYAVRKNCADDTIKINVLVEPSLNYVDIYSFSGGLAIVRKGRTVKTTKYGYIDKNCKNH